SRIQLRSRLTRRTLSIWSNRDPGNLTGPEFTFDPSPQQVRVSHSLLDLPSKGIQCMIKGIIKILLIEGLIDPNVQVIPVSGWPVYDRQAEAHIPIVWLFVRTVHNPHSSTRNMEQRSFQVLQAPVQPITEGTLTSGAPDTSARLVPSITAVC